VWKWRVLVLGFGGLVVVVTVAIAAGLNGTRSGEPSVALDELREEGVVFLDDHDLYVVWDEGEPLALSADAQHIGDDVLFCRSSGLFESPAHGEKFDRRGYYYGGPAQSGLDRYPVRIDRGYVFVDVAHPIPGPPRGAGPAQEPRGPFCDTFAPVEEGEPGFYEENG
jgi:Rieske Fe-S protein